MAPVEISPVSERGKETQDIVNIMIALQMPKEDIRMAIFGMADVGPGCYAEYSLKYFNAHIANLQDLLGRRL